jgi:hypothetical protein
MKDPKVKLLPKKYQNNLVALRKYSSVLTRMKNKKEIKQRRKCALNWRNNNLKKYYKNQSRMNKALHNIANTFLLKQIELY